MSDIKDCFYSRFENGKLVQFDYSQLEVICLAFLSGDDQLKLDLKSGIDMHSMSAAFLTGAAYGDIKKWVDAGDPSWTKARKDAKACSFLIQYGGGAGAMSRGTGLSLHQCKTFIANYYKRYKRVEGWQKEKQGEVKKKRYKSHKMKNGYQLGMSHLNSLTGRRYVFTEQIAPEFLRTRGVMTSFSPTQIKNYPVQGFATGDIVPMMLGILNRWMKKHKLQSVLVNTIHDSIILDMTEEEVMVGMIDEVAGILERAPEFLKSVFGIEFDMQLLIDVEYGDTWGSMVPYESP